MDKATTEHIVWHQHAIDRAARAALNGHPPLLLWFTGLSGSGKSTLAGALEHELHRRGVRTYLLDGDNVRHGLCSDLGFAPADRQENLRRVGEVAKLMVDAGLVVLAAFVSPSGMPFGPALPMVSLSRSLLIPRLRLVRRGIPRGSTKRHAPARSATLPALMTHMRRRCNPRSAW